jgi:aminoglycoside phosphotransferase (APT) family kinase protein
VPMHPDQLEISEPTVRGLVDDQFPRWRGLPVRAVRSQGTVNAIFRIGEELTARFPLQGKDSAAVRADLEREAEAARAVHHRTPFPTPEPVAIGEPGAGYPLPWSVQTWLPGTVVTPDSVAHSEGFAVDLAEFVAAVRAIDADGATFAGLGRSGRGGDLRAHDGWMQTCFERGGGLVDVAALRRLWGRLRELPRGGAPDVMTHGDLMPGNLLRRPDGAGGAEAGARPGAGPGAGPGARLPGARLPGVRLPGVRLPGVRLAGVLDVGGLGPADPALDLVCAWHLFESVPRAVLRERLTDDPVGCDDLMWLRGQAWAFEQAMGAAWYYADSNPAMHAMGLRTLDRLLRS